MSRTPGLKPNDYLMALVNALHDRGISQSAIDLYRRRWRRLPGMEPGAACPFCFVRGVSRTLALETVRHGAERLICHHCGSVIDVSPCEA